MKYSPSMIAKNIMLALLLSASFFVIVTHIALGYFAFPQVDDFYMAVNVHKNHETLFGLIKKMYLSVSGRFSNAGTAWLVNAAITSIYHIKFFIILSVALFVAAIIVALRSLHSRFSAMFVVDAAFLLWILPLRVKQQSLYYLLGNVDYLFPISLFLLMVAAMHRIRPLTRETLFCLCFFTCSIILGGFNEQLSAGMIAYAAIYLVLAHLKWLTPSSVVSRRLIVFFIGLAIGFVIDVIAPGNYIRHNISTGGLPQDIPALLAASFRDVAYTSLPLFLLTLYYGFVRACVFTAPSLRTPISAKTMKVYALSTATICFGLFFVVRYGYNSTDHTGMAGRTILMPQLLVIFYALVLGSWLVAQYSAVTIRSRKILPMMLAGTFLLVLHFYLPVLSDRTDTLFKSIALAEKQQESAFQQFRAAEAASIRGDTGVVELPAIKNYFVLVRVVDITPNADDWKNMLVADYFGLERVVPKATK